MVLLMGRDSLGKPENLVQLEGNAMDITGRPVPRMPANFPPFLSSKTKV